MSLYAALYSFLAAQPALTDLVGDRIYPAIVPQQAALPALRIEIDDDGGALDFAGQGDLIVSEVQIDCLAPTLTQAQAMTGALRTALKNYRGVLGDRMLAWSVLNTEYDTFEGALDDGIFRISQAWTLTHF